MCVIYSYIFAVVNKRASLVIHLVYLFKHLCDEFMFSDWLCGPSGASRGVAKTRRRQGNGRVQLHNTNVAHCLSTRWLVWQYWELYCRYVQLRLIWHFNHYRNITTRSSMKSIIFWQNIIILSADITSSTVCQSFFVTSSTQCSVIQMQALFIKCTFFVA